MFGVRYGNVLASRGSVIPLFKQQIASGGPVTITLPEMTRFLLSLDSAVDTIFAAFRDAGRGEIFVPRVPAARIADVADAADRRPATIEIDRDRHPARREDPRDPRLRGGGATAPSSAAATTSSSRCCPSWRLEDAAGALPRRVLVGGRGRDGAELER